MDLSVNSVDLSVSSVDLATYRSDNVVVRLLSCSSTREHSPGSLEFLGKSKNIAS